MLSESLVLGKIFRDNLHNNIQWYADDALEYISLLGVNKVMPNCGEKCSEYEECMVMEKKGEDTFKQKGVALSRP